MTKERIYDCTDCQFYEAGYCFVNKDYPKDCSICSFFEGVVNVKL